MSLDVNDRYKGPRTGTFYKVLVDLRPKYNYLMSPYQGAPYPFSGLTRAVTPTVCNGRVEEGYHVFVDAESACVMAFMNSRRVYVVEGIDFFAGGTWCTSRSAVFSQLNVLGPFTGNT